MRRYRVILVALLAAIAAIALAVELHPPSAPSAGGTPLIPEEARSPAPDLSGIDGWINSAPLQLTGLRGRVVLVDFWTYSCVDCIRSLPGLHRLESRHRGELVIIGVHSPEFDFEKDASNVEAAVRRLGVDWPVARDTRMQTWNAYQNIYWPAQYLLDRQGRVARVHVGEGDEDGTEAAVSALLGGGDGSAQPPGSPRGPERTPELYAGSSRGTLAGGVRLRQGERTDLPDRGPPADADRIQLAGGFVDRGDSVESVTAGRVRVRFHAAQVVVVAAPVGPGRPLVGVRLDGADPPAAQRDTDLGAAGLVVDRSDLFHVLDGVPRGEHLLELEVPAGLRLYVVDFGGSG